jgi:hypothetical protein
MRSGAAKRLACVASWRAHWARNPLAENDDMSATLAPTEMAAAKD